MRYRVVYHIMFFALVLYFWAPARMAGGEGSAVLQENSPRRLLPAQKSLGFTLVGTVVADDPRMSVAVVEISTTGQQRAYPEGKRLGEVQIKKILYNHVIIDAGRGDEVLRMHAQASASQPAQQPDVKNRPPAARYQSFRLDREEVTSSLKDFDRVMQQVHLAPYTVYGKASGLRINNIQPGSIFSKMGLRSGDVIRGVNDEVITGPEQAAMFFQRLMEGGDITIRVKGKRRSRRIHLTIE